MPKIGLTGTIASGKTTVLKEFARLGAETFDCDRRIHRYYRMPGHPVYEKIKEVFPGLARQNEICRRGLKEIVLADSEKLKKLEEIVHPVIIEELKRWLAEKENRIPCVAEVPLLFEKKLDKLFDKVILVKAAREILIRRLQEKYGLGKKEISRRLSLYRPDAGKQKRADFVLRNNAGFDTLQKEVGLLWRKIKAS